MTGDTGLKSFEKSEIMGYSYFQVTGPPAQLEVYVLSLKERRAS
jgi:hypothetical protein